MDFFRDEPSSRAGPTIAGHYDAVAFDFIALLWRRRMLILFSGLALAAVAAAILMLIPRRYSAEVVLQFEFAREDMSRAGKSVSAVALEPNSLVESEARIIRSMSTARAVVTQLGLDKAASPRPSGIITNIKERLIPSYFRDPAEPAKSADGVAAARRDLIARELLGSLTVSNDAKAYLIVLTYRDRDPERAAAIVNAFASEYNRRKLDSIAAASQRSSAWYGAQAKEARSDLVRVENAIDGFRARTGFIEIGQDGSDIQQQLLRDTLAQLNTASAARLAEETRLRRVQESLAAGNVPQAADIGGSPVAQALLDEESKARRALDEMVAITGDRHPAVARLRASLAAVQDRLKKQLSLVVGNLETDLSAAKEVEQRLLDQVAALQQKSIKAKSLEVQLQSLQAEATGIRERLKLLVEAEQQAAAVSGLKTGFAQILAPAEVPTLPTSSSPLLILALSFGGGIFAGSALAYLLEKRDNGFRTEQEFAAQTHLQCVGLLPNLERFPNGLDSLLFAEAVRSTVAELFCGANPPKVVLVTSSAPGEGKSLIASAMARILSTMGQRVLVVDGSPRRALVGARLPHEVMLDQFLPKADAGGENSTNTATIRRASGLRDGQNVYSNSSFKSMMKEARNRYDVILFEVAPVLLSGDSALLREHADAVLHVVRWNDTPRATVSTSLNHLARLGLHVGGVLLNGVDLEQQRHYYSSDRGKAYRDYKSFYQASA